MAAAHLPQYQTELIDVRCCGGRSADGLGGLATQAPEAPTAHLGRLCVAQPREQHRGVAASLAEGVAADSAVVVGIGQAEGGIALPTVREVHPARACGLLVVLGAKPIFAARLGAAVAQTPRGPV